MQTNCDRIDSLARFYTREIERAMQAEPPARGVRRLARAIARARQWVVRKVLEILRNHWDVGAFDLAFGSVKAFGVYPALFFAGMAWAIPLLEFALLNTQLWTAGYLFLRRKVANWVGKKRYGFNPTRLDALRRHILQSGPVDLRHVHRFVRGGREWTIRVRGSRLQDWWERHRGHRRVPNIVLQSELRRWTRDPEFLHHANALRDNPYLYERVLLNRVLAKPEARQELLQVAACEVRSHDETARLLADPLEDPAEIWARTLELGRISSAALQAKLGSATSAPALGLRWILASYRRKVSRELAERQDLEFRLLSEIMRGGDASASPHVVALRRKQGETRVWIQRAEGFVARIEGIHSLRHARELLRTAIDEARSRGLPVRLARAAYRFSFLDPVSLVPPRRVVDGY